MMTANTTGIMSELTVSGTDILETSSKLSGLTSEDIILSKDAPLNGTTGLISLLQQIPPYDTNVFTQEQTHDLMVSF